MGSDAISGYEVTYIDGYWQENERVVLIVDDHQVVRDGMRLVIRDVLSGMSVDFLEASTFAEARQVIDGRKGGVDLVLLDISLPDACGADELECLRSEWAGLPVVVVSASEEWGLAADFLRAGALGFISKSSSVAVMVNALRLIFAGGRYFPSQVLGLLDSKKGGQTLPVSHEREVSEDKIDVALAEAQASAETQLNATDLSPRQKEVLELILKGCSNKEIARELGVSVGTTKNYVAAVLRAFNATSRGRVMRAVLGVGVSVPSAKTL